MSAEMPKTGKILRNGVTEAIIFLFVVTLWQFANLSGPNYPHPSHYMWISYPQHSGFSLLPPHASDILLWCPRPVCSALCLSVLQWWAVPNRLMALNPTLRSMILSSLYPRLSPCTPTSATQLLRLNRHFKTVCPKEGKKKKFFHENLPQLRTWQLHASFRLDGKCNSHS